MVALESILGLAWWCWSELGFQDEVVDDPRGDTAWMVAEGGGLAPQAQRVGLWSSGEPDARKQAVEQGVDVVVDEERVVYGVAFETGCE